jgi:hypothetical protein
VHQNLSWGIREDKCLCPSPRDSDLVGLECGPGMSISLNKIPCMESLVTAVETKSASKKKIKIRPILNIDIF